MLRFAVNLSWLFDEYPMEERFHKAREQGFEAVEMLYPYEYSKRELKKWLEDSGTGMIQINTFPGDRKNGETGFAACPGKEKEFRDSMELALDYALALNCERLHVMAGNTGGMDFAECDRTYRKNLLWAVRETKKHGIVLQIEPLNPQDSPGYFLCSMPQASEVVADLRTAFGNDSAGLQLDVYHLAKMEGDILSPLPRLLPRTSHIQISDVPGRHEPGSGNLDFPAFFEALENYGYAGWIACEYRPSETTEKSLEWISFYKKQ